MSDIPPHLELLDYIDKENNIFLIKHEIISPIFHPALDYRCCGVQFDCTVKEIAKNIKDLYDNRTLLYTKDLIQERKNAGERVSRDGLQFLYSQVIRPQNIYKTDNNFGIFDNTFCMSKELYDKYQKYNFISKKQVITKKPEINKDEYIREKKSSFQLIEKFAIESQKIYLNLNSVKFACMMDAEKQLWKLRKVPKFTNVMLKMAFGVSKIWREIKKPFCKKKWRI
jgi:hypothetical protein